MRLGKRKPRRIDHRAGALDLVDDRAEIRLGRRDRDALQVVVPAEADDHDARIAGEDVLVDAGERALGRVAAHAGVDDRDAGRGARRATDSPRPACAP